MQAFLNPGRDTGDDKGRTVQEVRIELAARSLPGQPADDQYGVIVHIHEYGDGLLISVEHGDAQWRPRVPQEHRPRKAKRLPPLPALMVDAVAIPLRR